MKVVYTLITFNETTGFNVERHPSKIPSMLKKIALLLSGGCSKCMVMYMYGCLYLYTAKKVFMTVDEQFIIKAIMNNPLTSVNSQTCIHYVSRPMMTRICCWFVRLLSDASLRTLGTRYHHPTPRC